MSSVGNTSHPSSGSIPKEPKQVRSIARYPPQETLGTYFKAAKRNFLKTQGLLFALLFVFLVTFTVFPGVTDHSYLTFILSLQNDLSWFNLFMTTVFNVMDTVGRKMGGLKTFDLEGVTIKILSLARVIFVLTFLLVAFEVGPMWLF
jgi:hypothetical protein